MKVLSASLNQPNSDRGIENVSHYPFNRLADEEAARRRLRELVQ